MSGELVPYEATENPQALEQRADDIRHELADLISELVRRRRRLFDVPARLRENALPIGLVAVGLVGVAVAARALARNRPGPWRRRGRKARREGARWLGWAERALTAALSS